MGEVIDINRGQKGEAIKFLLQQVWPANREKGDFRRLVAEQAELELRVTICGHCQKQSRPLDGPTGRAWWAHHQSVCGGLS